MLFKFAKETKPPLGSFIPLTSKILLHFRTKINTGLKNAFYKILYLLAFLRPSILNQKYFFSYENPYKPSQMLFMINKIIANLLLYKVLLNLFRVDVKFPPFYKPPLNNSIHMAFIDFVFSLRWNYSNSLRRGI